MLAVGERPWATQALCAGHDADEFVVDTSSAMNAKTRATIISNAVAICNQCPVRDECRDWALHGPLDLPGAVLGGMDPVSIWKYRNNKDHAEARRLVHRPRCGTLRAYKIHLSLGEACPVCREWHAARLYQEPVSRAS